MDETKEYVKFKNAYESSKNIGKNVDLYDDIMIRCMQNKKEIYECNDFLNTKTDYRRCRQLMAEVEECFYKEKKKIEEKLQIDPRFSKK